MKFLRICAFLGFISFFRIVSPLIYVGPPLYDPNNTFPSISESLNNISSFSWNSIILLGNNITHNEQIMILNLNISIRYLFFFLLEGNFNYFFCF